MIKQILLVILLICSTMVCPCQSFAAQASSKKPLTVYTFSGPRHYPEGKVPISKWEQRAYDEYQQKVKARGKQDMTLAERDEIKNAVAYEIAENYKMPPMSVAYLVLKILYKEVPPPGYVKPSKPRKR